MRIWFRELEPNDTAQRIFAFFLQLATSVPADIPNNYVAFVFAQALRRNAVRWARREQLKLMEGDRIVGGLTKQTEPFENISFESVSLLNEFLDYCFRMAFLSQCECDLRIKVKADGFVAKEVLDRHTVLSPKAVHVRIRRIMKRLQEAAWESPSQNGNPTTPVKSDEPEKTKIFQKV